MSPLPSLATKGTTHRLKEHSLTIRSAITTISISLVRLVLRRAGNADQIKNYLPAKPGAWLEAVNLLRPQA